MAGDVGILLGSYSEFTPWTGAPDGHGAGVGLATFDTASGGFDLLSTLDLPSPSFLAADGDRVWISTETRAVAQVHSGRVQGGEILLDAHVETGVPSACHIGQNPGRSLAVVTHYHGHRVTLLGIDEVGRAHSVLDVFELPGDTRTFERSRQTSLPHYALWLDDERVLIPDCGRDAVSIYGVANGSLSLLGTTFLPWGCGPRHAVAHGSKVYVSLQNQGGVAVLDDNGAGDLPLREIVDSPGLGRAQSVCSHIDVHRPSGTVYVANRRDDSISIYSPTAAGGLELRSTLCAHGVWPRHFALTPADDYLLLANQNSNEVVAYAVAADGMLNFTGNRLYFPTPTAVAPLAGQWGLPGA